MLTRRLLRWVDPDRGAELRSHIDDSVEAGDPLRAADAASVFHMAARTQASKALVQLPLVVAGLPILLLCLIAYGMIYETHFAPWDLMEEVQTTDPLAAALRRALDLAWLVLVPLWAVSGWRAVRSIRERRFLLPAMYVACLVALISQSDIFIERTAWFERGRIDPSDVDSVSPHSLALMSLVFVLPLAYLLLDVFEQAHQRTGARLGDPKQAVIAQGRFDPIAIAAIIAPCLAVIIPIVPLLLFLPLVWLTPTFRLRHKIAATTVIVTPVLAAAAVWSDGGIDDPGVGALGFLGAFVAVWGWLAAVALQPRTTECVAVLRKT